jgi:hypothetical protein
MIVQAPGPWPRALQPNTDTEAIRETIARENDNILAFAADPVARWLYRRHGFESLGTIQIGSSPPIVPKLRRPR